MMGPDTPGTFTPRVPSKGYIGDMLEGFMHMQALGADVVEALMACLGGHRMTPDLAALCIGTYWRRYQSTVEYATQRGAAMTMQVCAAAATLLQHHLACDSAHVCMASPRPLRLHGAGHPPSRRLDFGGWRLARTCVRRWSRW
jgi:hypothetical protein